MTEPKRKARNEQRLAETYPTFANRLRATIADLEQQGLRPRIQEAWRSMDEQRKAYERVLPSASSRHVVETVPALRVPGIAQRHGLTTGIRWGLPPALRKAIDDAIAAKAWTARVKIGWGPAHVETAGVTPGEAKAGMRPT